ncbi:MAG: hypothetical protein HYU36_05630 [Planctomycetes bacterium]|nr:hypothetical protein [Planctomycetota bacterium]
MENAPASSPPSPRQFRKRLLVCLAVLLILAATLRWLVFPAVISASFIRQNLEQALEQASGCGVRLGRLEERGWMGLVLHLDTLGISNPPGFSRSEILSAESITAPVSWIALLRRQVVITGFVVAKLQVRIEENVDGRFNVTEVKGNGATTLLPREEGLPRLQANNASPPLPLGLERVSGSVTTMRVIFQPPAGPAIEWDRLSAAIGLSGPNEPVRFSLSSAEQNEKKPGIALEGDLTLVQGGQILPAPRTGRVQLDASVIPLPPVKSALAALGVSVDSSLATLAGIVSARQRFEFSGAGWHSSGTLRLGEAAAIVALVLHVPFGDLTLDHEMAWQERSSLLEIKKARLESRIGKLDLIGRIEGYPDHPLLQLDLDGHADLEAIQRSAGLWLRLLGQKAAFAGAADLRVRLDGDFPQPRFRLGLDLTGAGFAWETVVLKKAGHALEFEAEGDIRFQPWMFPALDAGGDDPAVAAVLGGISGDLDLRSEEIALGNVVLSDLSAEGSLKEGKAKAVLSARVGVQGKIGLSLHTGLAGRVLDSRLGLALEMPDLREQPLPFGVGTARISAAMSLDAAIQVAGLPYSIDHALAASRGQGSLRLGPGTIQGLASDPMLRSIFSGPVLNKLQVTPSEAALPFDRAEVLFKLEGGAVLLTKLNLMTASQLLLEGQGGYSIHRGEVSLDLALTPSDDFLKRASAEVATAWRELPDGKLNLRIRGTPARPTVEYRAPRAWLARVLGEAAANQILPPAEAP